MLSTGHAWEWFFGVVRRGGQVGGQMRRRGGREFISRLSVFTSLLLSFTLVPFPPSTLRVFSFLLSTLT